MKRSVYLFCLSAAMLFASCKGEGTPEAPSGGFGVTGTIRDCVPVVRTAVDEGSVSWHPEDAIGVFGGEAVNRKFVATGSGPEVGFDPATGTSELVEFSTLYAYYPWGEANTDMTAVEAAVPAIQTYENGDNKDKMFMVAKTTVTEGRAKFVFKNLFTVLEFGLKGEGITLVSMTLEPRYPNNCGTFTGKTLIDLEDPRIGDVDEAGKSITVNFPGGLTLGAAETWVPVAVMPFSCASGGMRLTFTDVDGMVYAKPAIWTTTGDLAVDNTIGKVDIRAGYHIRQAIKVFDPVDFREPVSVKTITITQPDITESTSYNSDAVRNWSTSDFDFQGKSLLNDGGNISMRGGDRGTLYNLEPFGRIKSIVVTQTNESVLTSGIVPYAIDMYVGTAPQPAVTKITPETADWTYTYVFPEESNYYFFRLIASATALVTSVVVEYEEAPFAAPAVKAAADFETEAGTTATLNGAYLTGNLSGGEDIVCGFELSPSDGAVVGEVSVNSLMGTFSAEVTGLTPGTEYTCRSKVSIDGGTTYVTSDASVAFTPAVAVAQKTVTINLASMTGITASYSTVNWAQGGISLTATQVLNDPASNPTCIKGQKTNMQIYNTTSMGEIASVAITTVAYASTNSLTVAGGVASRDDTKYLQTLTSPNNSFSVEFPAGTGYFTIKSPSQNIYIESITIIYTD